MSLRCSPVALMLATAVVASSPGLARADTAAAADAPHGLTLGVDVTAVGRVAWMQYAGPVPDGSLRPIYVHGAKSDSVTRWGLALGLHAGWHLDAATTVGFRGEVELNDGSSAEIGVIAPSASVAALGYVNRDWGDARAYRTQLEAGHGVAGSAAGGVDDGGRPDTTSSTVSGWRFGAWGARSFRSSPTWAWRVGPDVVLDLLADEKGAAEPDPRRWRTTSLRFGLRGSVAWD